MAAMSARWAGLMLLAGALYAADGYVGSKACYGCHSAIYKSFEKTAMGRSITPAGEWKPGVLPAEATVPRPLPEAASARVLAVSHKETGWVQSESEAGVFSVEHKLAYAVGSGANGLTFLIRRGSYLFQAPLSYYARTQKWDFSPGYEQADIGFGRLVPEECINCHAGRALPLKNRPGAYEDAMFEELAIGCENCHGPGERHVRSLGKQAAGIVNPAKLAPRLAENICINCHQGGDARVTQPGKSYLDFRPGEWLFDTAVILKEPARTSEQKEADLLEHYSAMQASRCFRASAGKLGCLTCHDPHVEPGGARAVGYYRAKCLTCHNEKSCSLPLKTRLEHTPADDCAGCHMPKRDVRQISHSALTNHRIPARAGEAAPASEQKDVDGVVVVDPPGGRAAQLSKVTLLRAYQQLGTRNADYQQRFLHLLDELSNSGTRDAFVEAALGHKAFTEDKPEEAAAHFKRALPLGDTVIYLEMGQALAKLGRREEALESLRKAVEMDPFNAAAQKTLILEYINERSYTEARRNMEQYVETFPEDSFMRNLLARVGK